ncbi:PD-(D/E)XK nuclease family protein [Sulfurimonas sp. SAG-AH-194-C21]|nr:PD-(D/E)XK nuclease family protein [Sulfurimonas sp. SAG-AH-194-C21]MDF1882932.1 PD-(D/E)XK nuclease family protein [Sulfurimonas sp. SAG-AH-194-C21]
MDERTLVLPSARAIRDQQLQLREESLFLPNYITMSDFISQLCIVNGYQFIDEDSRVLLLLEASDFSEFSNLQIERNFFTFTKNSSYIFKFFEEISAELYDINELASADLYAEYEEHITILIELYKRYEKLCNERKYLDRIFLPKLYEFNEAYAKNHQDTRVKIAGHLTNFEFELLETYTNFAELQIEFTTSAFNTKMQTRFLDLGIELEAGYEYLISLNDKKVLEKNKVIKNENVECESFSEALLQVSFVKKKIYEFVQKGYKAENIAVILPDESRTSMLKIFDEKCNFNFAMGEPFVASDIYIKLNASIKRLDLDSQENYARLNRVGDELYEKLRSIYKSSLKEIDFIAFLSEICEFIHDKKELKIFNEELYSFEKIISFMQEMNIKSLLSLFMQRLAGRTLDDVRGGKVTVMGVLETRSVAFDAVIIMDFDDKNVPKRSDKDMFLNTAVRENANLPTMSDRENLQKHYYEMLINSSKEVALCFVNSSESSASRFLKQLSIKDEKIHEELDYANILFKREKKSVVEPVSIALDYSFKDVKLSATRLKTYLTCKRRYYHKYIQKLYGHDIPQDVPQEYEIGNVVHLALKEVYSKKNSYEDARELQKDLEKELDIQCGKSELDKYLISLQKKRLQKFYAKEIQRFTDGFEVYSCEESFSVEYAGMTLMGQIDRVDKRDNEIEVLDYKTGSYKLYNKNNFTEATDFQLEFYYLLTQALGDVTSCAFYDLKEVEIVPEAFLNEKLEILQSHIKDLLQVESIDFILCEDLAQCKYCEYAVMCGRD